MFHTRRVDDVSLVRVEVVVVANCHDRVGVVAEEHRWYEETETYLFYIVKI